VRTLDHGLQPVDWVGQREVPGLGRMAPVEIAAGALGNRRKIVVSPQHRMLVSDWRTELYFGQGQVLVAAVHLVNGTTIRQVPRRRVHYVHLAFKHHQIVFSEGIASESLHLGAMALNTMSAAQREEIEAIFPELMGTAGSIGHPTARQCLKRWEAALVD
ncbi:Hint domain-containing protein, partial [Loktanella sp. SALINAS62]|uniref:Hint domain-containing protein n=1 Tax=Loktanella sp. SALINAS62 TaxID=2706124 RepID=UPI001B8BCFBE